MKIVNSHYNKRQIRLNFDIHNLICIQINSPHFFEFLKDINQPLSYFEKENVKDPHILLNINKFTPDKNGCDLINNKIFIKQNYIYCTEIIDKIKIHCEIIGLEHSPTIINFNLETKKVAHKLFPLLMAQNLILRPLIDFKLLQKNIISLHAAGVANENGAIIMAGRGGAFKTTLAMDLVRKSGYRFIGEDRLLLGRDKQVFSYPIYHKLFDYRLKKMKTEKFSFFNKFNYIFYRLKDNFNKGYIKDVSKLKIFFSIVMHRKNSVNHHSIEKIDLIKKMRLSQQLENISAPGIMNMSSGVIYEYFASYAFKFPFSKIAAYWSDYERILSENLEEKKYLEIYIPPNYDSKIYNDVLGLIQN
jgi:hypothetical protein